MTAYLIVIIILGLFVLFKIRSSYSKYKAATNALAAKYTFETLDGETQQKVIDQAFGILINGNIEIDHANRVLNSDKLVSEDNPERRMDVLVKYGIIALAMAELNIQPALSDYYWQLINNPFIALINAEKEIQAAKLQFIRSDGVEIDI